jgi:hypothetical protein
VLEPAQESKNAAFSPKPVLVPAVTHRSAPTSTVAPTRPQPLGEEVRLDISQAAEVPATVPSPTRAAAPARVAEIPAAPETDAFRDRMGASVSAYSTDLPTGVDSSVREERAAATAPVQIAEALAEEPAPVAAPEEPAYTPAQTDDELSKKRTNETKTADADAGRLFGRRRKATAPAPAVPPPPAPMVEAAPPVETITVTASAPAIAGGTAYASELTLRQKGAVFGISVDPKVFLDMKAAIEDGKLPSASSVNVDALVNYFTGPPERAPRRVMLEVEASPAPVESEGDHAVLRFTIDTPRITVAPRESTPPAAADAHVDIEIDPKAVANFHRIGGDVQVGTESILLHNLSVTGLYDLELHPQLKATQHVATVRLRYRSVADGKAHVITRVVRGSDLALDWSRASRRHRLASLGAVWSESLKGAGARQDVAKRAEELATQEPKDLRARELAKAASATAGGKR